MSEMFLVLDVDVSKRSDNALWWRPNNSGYTTVVDRAGRYTREQIEKEQSYYDNGKSTVAVPEDVALGCAVSVVPMEKKFWDQVKSEQKARRNGRKLKNPVVSSHV